MTRADEASKAEANRVRRGVFALAAAMLFGAGYLLAQRSPHGFYAGIRSYDVELVFHDHGIYIGGHRGGRYARGVGYDTGAGLRNWNYLARIGGTTSKKWLGARWVTAPFFWFILVVPWGLAASLAIALVGAFAYPLLRKHAPGLCRTCGYDLRGTQDHCPECGTVPTCDRVGATVAIEARIGFWCAAAALSITAMEFVIAPRHRLPNWSVLAHIIASALAFALIGVATARERRMSRYTIGATVFFVAALLRCLIPRLNY